MSDNYLDDLREIFKISQDSEIKFKQAYGLTFVFIKEITSVNDMISSAEIRPLGIIYDENDEYYFAPLDEVGEVDGIVEEFVEKFLKN